MEATPATPIKTNFSANFNHHRVVRQGADVLLLQPARDNSMLWTGVRILALSPIIYLVVHHFSTDRQLLLWGTLMPWLGGVPPIVFSLAMGTAGMRARFDCHQGELTLTGMQFGDGARYGLNEIREVQLCSAGVKGGGRGGTWEAFQLNLLVEQAGQSAGVNLLENADERGLRDMGCSISEFLKIPFNDAAKNNMAFRREARKIGTLLARRVVSIFLFVLAGFCLTVACVMWSSNNVDRWAPMAVGLAGLGICIFTAFWAFSWRMSSFHCPNCGGPVKTVRGKVNNETLLVCERCGQTASTGLMG